MAKPPTSKPRPDRRAVVDQMRARQKRADHRRNVAIVGACALVAVVIVGAAAFRPVQDWWDLRQARSLDLTEIGAPASACADVVTDAATGNQEHVQPGTPLDYPDAPPAFGRHYDMPDTIERKFYTAADRPDLGTLVHNLEHGYTLLWYDENVAQDDAMMDDLRAIAEKYEGSDNLRLKFKAVPWTDDDGSAFPDGKHVALTHWSASGEDQGQDAATGGGSEQKQVGVWSYCDAPSGEALEQFMLDYPYTDSPEPLAQ